MAILQERLDEFRKSFESGAPPYNAPREAIEKMHRATAELKATGIEERALRVGRSRSQLHLIQPGSRAGCLGRPPPRRFSGNQLLPRTLVTILQHGAGGWTANPF